MKALLVALNAKYVHTNLAVYDLMAYARRHSEYSDMLEVREYTINQNTDTILGMLYTEHPDFIAFSCYIWNIREVLLIAKGLKKVNPSVKIWLGGPEVSYNSQQIINDYEYIDGVINGEGEITFGDLIDCWGHGGYELGKIKGITYRGSDGIIVQMERQELVSMDEIPFIYEDFSEYENKILYYESSRGCPFSCSYCLSSIDKTVRFRSLELVEKELQKFLDAKVPQVKFIDRTFNCDKNRAFEIWSYITDNDNGVTNFHFEVAADLIDDRDLELFSRMSPGLIQLEIGLQSTNPATILEIRRVMDINRLKQNMLAIRKLGNIHQHLDLIAGLPFEDYESFKKSFCDAYMMEPHQLQLGFLKVLKGSYMEEKSKEYELVYHEEQPYEVMSTKWITYDEILILKRVEEMVEVYHNSGQFDNVLAYLMTFFDSSYQCFLELADYYEDNGLAGIGHKREARYLALREFARKKLESIDLFDDLLTYDYYLRENAKTRPSWRKDEPIEKTVYNDFFRRGGTEEFSLADSLKVGTYDSKTMSRKMHIEPISVKAAEIILCKLNVEVPVEGSCPIYCLFDYDSRCSLSGDANVYYLNKL